ncbi:unnamed protein product, partial [Larinioides sclopetarius]
MFFLTRNNLMDKPLYYISNLLAQSVGFYQRCVPSTQDYGSNSSIYMHIVLWTRGRQTIE